MGSETLNKAINVAVRRLLTPLVRVLLRNGISFAEFSEVAKRIYVDVATEECVIPGKSQTTSRISTLTGLTRKDVQRIKQDTSGDDLAHVAKFNRAARVIDAWISDPRFQDKKGEPALLPFDDGEKSFTALVKDASGDITPRTILDELTHVRAVEQDDKGRLKLLVRAYIPDGDDAGKIAILGMDAENLISTIDHNLRCKKSQSYFQRKVCYDNLPEEVMEELRQTIAEKAQAALEDMNEYMSKCDRDRDDSIEGTGRVRAGLGIYYFQESVKESKDE